MSAPVLNRKDRETRGCPPDHSPAHKLFLDRRHKSRDHQSVRDTMLAMLVERLTDRRDRVTPPDTNIPAMRPHRLTRGIGIGNR